MHDGYNIGSATEPKRSYLEIRLAGFKESQNRLDTLRERLERLEIKLSGEAQSDFKDRKEINEKMSGKSDDITQPSIIEDYNSTNNFINSLIDDLDTSITHLEELI